MTGPSAHGQEPIDRWLAGQHDDLRNGLMRYLDPDAGLREAMLHAEHSGLLGALGSRLDTEAGLAAFLQPPSDTQQPPRPRLVQTGEPPTFALRVDHNRNLAVGQHTVDAIVQVAAAESDPPAGVRLRIRLSGQVRITYFAQVTPSIEDLTGKGVVVDGGQAVEFPLGHWGAQARDYHLRLEASQSDLRIGTGSLARAARLEVVLPAPGQGDGDARVAASASLTVSWTTDIVLSASINPRVAAYNDQEDLAAAVNAGLDAWRNGRPDAEEKIGLAVMLAHQARHEALLERFSAIAELVDPAAGVVRLRRYDQVSQVEVLWASYLSEQSRYVEPDERDPDDSDG